MPRRQSHQRQGRSFFPFQMLRFINYVRTGHRQKFRVTAIAATADDVVFRAEIIASGEAFSAVAARDARMQHDFITGFDPSDQLTNFADHAADIVAENVWERNLDAGQASSHPQVEMIQRSEERRVGKECRSTW